MANTADIAESWDTAAAGWNQHGPLIHAWLREATHAMLEGARIGLGARVLDVAAGAGDQTLDVACRVGHTGWVLATDVSPGILALAQKNAEAAWQARRTSDNLSWCRWPQPTPPDRRYSWGCSNAVVILQVVRPTEPAGENPQ